MTENEKAEDLRESISDVIGLDYVWVPATKGEKQLAGMDAALIYAGSLFLIFATAAAAVLKEKIESEVKKLGKQFADAVWKNIDRLLKGQPSASKPVDDKAQLEEIRIALDAAEELGQSLSNVYLEIFLTAGEKSIYERLLKDLPEEKARQHSKNITEEIRKRIHTAQEKQAQASS